MAIKFLSGLNLSNVTAGSILKLDSNGNIVAAVDGTDYNTSSSLWSTAGTGGVNINKDVRIGTFSSDVLPEARLHVYAYQTTDPKLLIEDGNTGDASMEFKISTQSYTMGIDNSDSDKFILAASSALGTTNVLEISTTGAPAFQGDLLVNGTMYSNAADITGRLDVASDLRLRGSSSSNDLGVVRLYTDAGNHLYLDTGNNGGQVAKFAADGSLTLNSSNSQGLTVKQSANSGNDMQVEIRGSRNAPGAGVNPAKLILSSYDNDDGTGVVKTGAEFYMESTSLTGGGLTDFEVGLRYRKDGSVVDGISIHDGQVTAHGSFVANTVYSPTIRVSGTNDHLTLRSDIQVDQGSTDPIIEFKYGTTQMGKFDQDGYMYATGFKTTTASTGFLKADGSVDTSTYVASSALSSYLPLTGGTLTGDLTLGDGTNASNTNAYSAFDQLIFDNSHNSAANGPNKIVMHDSGSGWQGGFGIHTSTVAYYTGDSHKWYKSASGPGGYSYSQNMALDSSGNLSIAGSLTATGYNSTNWDTAYTHSQAAHAPSNAEQNVQSDWNETGTTSDAFIKNKPTLGTAAASAATDFVQDFGTTAQSNINTIGGASGKYRWNNSTTGRPASSQSNEYGTLLHLQYDSSYATQLAYDIDQSNLYIRHLALATDTGSTWKRIADTGYVDTAVANLVDSSPAALNTLNELAAALGDDASFSTTMSTALGNRLRIDVNNQSLSSTELSNARTNLGLGTAATSAATDFVAVSGDSMTGDLTSTGVITSDVLRLTNDATDTTRHRIAVYDSGSTSYGMMLWNSNGASGDWATMIYGPNQSNRRISFGKANANFATNNNHAGVDEIAHFDLDDSSLNLSGDLKVNGGDVTITKQNDAPTLTLLHDGTNPSTNDLLFVMQFQSDYDGTHQNWGKIICDTNNSAVRTNLDFFVKSASGSEQLGFRIEGQPSATPKAYFYNNVDVDGALSATNLTIADSIIHEGDTNTSISFGTDTINFNTGGGVRATINDSSAKFNNNTIIAGGSTLSLGERAEGDDNGRTVLIEGVADASSGEGSGRIFFTEHNSTDAAADKYGLSLYYEGNGNAQLPSGFQPNTGNATWSLRRHNNSVNGDAIMSGSRSDSNVTFSGTVNVGASLTIPEYIYHNGDSNTYVRFTADRIRIVAGGSTKFDSDSTYVVDSAPAAPTNLSLSVVNDTINVTFTASATSGIDSYFVFSSVDGGDYSLISMVAPDDFGATMSIIDNAFDATGTQAYRVYAIKNGIISADLTGSISYSVTSPLEPTNMSVVNLNTAFYVQWDAPSANARFVTAYNVYKHEHATESSLDRDSATLIYSGNNYSYMYQISGGDNNNFHKFWVETTVA